MLDQVFSPPIWIVPELLTTGLTILVGAPKLGKSWLVLALCEGVGKGGKVLGEYEVEKRQALYLALEDTPRRVKKRLSKINASRSSSFVVYTQWKSGVEGLSDLDAYLSMFPDTKLVVIDTFGRFRGSPGLLSGISSKDQYSADYADSAKLKSVADRHECAIVVIHHTRKAESDDPLDMVSGTNGLNGGADATWILKRSRGESDATLFMTGRDIEEVDLSLRFDRSCATWASLGNAENIMQSEERREMLDLIPFEPSFIKTADIVEQTGKKGPAVSRLIKKLEDLGIVFSPKRGLWSRRDGKDGKLVISSTSNCDHGPLLVTDSPHLPIDYEEEAIEDEEDDRNSYVNGEVLSF